MTYWSYKKKCWQNETELTIEFPENIKDVKAIANLLITFLDKEKLPFKVLGKIEIFYSDKRADSNMNEYWDHAYVMIPILERGILRKPRYDKMIGKHFIKVRISLGKSILGTWQEYRRNRESACSYIHVWYMELDQIKAWKELLEKFCKSLPLKKAEIENPSAR